MMASPHGLAAPGAGQPSYPTQHALEEFARQMAASQAARRLSRGSNGQRAGTAMRVVKPSSANNSPRSSMGLARRRTLMNDGNLARRRQQVMDQVVLQAPGADFSDPTKRVARPVSWHPSSTQLQGQHITPSQPHAGQYPLNDAIPNFNTDVMYANYQQVSPVPASYSCDTSPSTFSPLSLPFTSFNTQPYLGVDAWSLPPQHTPNYVSPASDGSRGYAEPVPSLAGCSVSTQSTGAAEWDAFVLTGFNSTSPPTPESLPPAQQPQPTLPSDESIPYRPLEEAEEEGEILVGMGLYDPPQKLDHDVQLNNYHSSMNQLLGTTYRGAEPATKVLKLEETWEPPESDDEDGEDEDGDGDGEDAEDRCGSDRVNELAA